MKEQIYKISGMHCASCEVLIEKKLLEISSVKSVDASTSKGEVVIEYEGDKPDISKLNKIFSKENYIFSENGLQKKEKNPTFIAFGIAVIIIIIFLLLNKLGVSGIISVNSKSSLPAFFMLGILAGISSCAALVGGMVLSMSKQWQELYTEEKSAYGKSKPHIMFNIGRLVSYAVLGAALGALGAKLQISFKFTAFLVFAISILMIGLGLQMLGVKAFRKFQFTLPKSITRYISNEKNFQGKYMPFIMGAATFFLPCGFTITAQGLALLSGNAVQGSLIMFAFALGTVPMLFFIGLSSIKFSSKPHAAMKFSKVAGFLVLFFALFNIQTQMNVLGFTGFGDLFASGQIQQKTADIEGLPEIINGKQIVKMVASARGYSPNYIKVRAGIPVRWEIKDVGTSGCTNAVISRSLFSGAINLTPGQVSIKEFTPAKPGKYRFSCWMGMVTGIIEVVDVSSSSYGSLGATQLTQTSNEVVPSGSSGCGCGCGGGGGNTCGDK